jgi:hypothetical protein
MSIDPNNADAYSNRGNTKRQLKTPKNNCYNTAIEVIEILQMLIMRDGKIPVGSEGQWLFGILASWELGSGNSI